MFEVWIWMLDVCMQSLLCVLYWSKTSLGARKTISMNPGWKTIKVFKFCPKCNNLWLMQSLPPYLWYPPTLSSPFSALARAHTAPEVESCCTKSRSAVAFTWFGPSQEELRQSGAALQTDQKQGDTLETQCDETIPSSLNHLFPQVKRYRTHFQMSQNSHTDIKAQAFWMNWKHTTTNHFFFFFLIDYTIQNKNIRVGWKKLTAHHDNILVLLKQMFHGSSWPNNPPLRFICALAPYFQHQIS